MSKIFSETIRKSFMPDKLNVLFIGESPPAAGTFFYLGDLLTGYTRDAFSKVYGISMTDSEFLSRFMANNFYFDDLCLIPVNRLSNTKRNEVRRNSVPELSERLRVNSPKAIICVLITIKKYVLEAVKTAGIQNVPLYTLPYPSRGNQLRYVNELSESLLELQSAGIIGKELKQKY